MSLTRWLRTTPLAGFLEHSYLRVPQSGAGGGAAECALGSWETLGTVLASDGADAMVVRDGRRVEAAPPRNRDEAEKRIGEGCTILVRNAQQHDEGLTELARGFERDFHGPVNIHMYATPAGRFGFGWHYDAEEVFILQTVGKKEYALRKNTVNPWPLEETLPADMRYEREIMPLMRCLLAPGDWLYIPCGYWHRAEAKETSISLAVGVMAPAAISLFDSLRNDLLDSLLWRQRLPIIGMGEAGKGEELREQYRTLLAQLADDLQKRLQDERLVDELVHERLPPRRGDGPI
ncbi:MAG: cupin domain-containing protein [Planctomycetes bacterium]|nr:cupin domain-containing protein [Planctomycetota bacterium]